MITHVALFKWKDGIPDGHAARVAAALSGLPALIPTIHTYSVGPNVGDPRNSDFAVVGTFDDLDSFARYAIHPEHVKVRDELIVPWLGEYSVIQF